METLCAWQGCKRQPDARRQTPDARRQTPAKIVARGECWVSRSLIAELRTTFTSDKREMQEMRE